jgi:hypothetical protein
LIWKNWIFAVPKVKLKGLQLKYKQGISPTRPSVVTSTDSPNLKLSLGELDLSKISVVYEDEENKLKTALDFKKIICEV